MTGDDLRQRDDEIEEEDDPHHPADVLVAAIRPSADRRIHMQPILSHRTSGLELLGSVRAAPQNRLGIIWDALRALRIAGHDRTNKKVSLEVVLLTFLDMCAAHRPPWLFVHVMARTICHIVHKLPYQA